MFHNEDLNHKINVTHERSTFVAYTEMTHEELLKPQLKNFTLSGHHKDLQFPDTELFRAYKECPKNLKLRFFQ